MTDRRVKSNTLAIRFSSWEYKDNFNLHELSLYAHLRNVQAHEVLYNESANGVNQGLGCP